jgi:hypothetical protein
MLLNIKLGMYTTFYNNLKLPTKGKANSLLQATNEVIVGLYRIINEKGVHGKERLHFFSLLLVRQLPTQAFQFLPALQQLHLQLESGHPIPLDYLMRSKWLYFHTDAGPAYPYPR